MYHRPGGGHAEKTLIWLGLGCYMLWEGVSVCWDYALLPACKRVTAIGVGTVEARRTQYQTAME
jgi:hypothetical protein